MMEKHIVLSYYASAAIKEFCTINPVIWPERKLAEQGNVLTPTSAMAVFFELLSNRSDLPTQAEYAEACWETWSEWKDQLDKNTVDGLEARLYRNFYPSALDSLHVWAMLVESGQFERCILDTAQDAYSKTDLTVYSFVGDFAKIALSAGNPYTKQWTKYKRKVRGEVKNTIDILLPMNRPRQPGNKRWYEENDLLPVFDVLGLTPQWVNKQLVLFS